MTQKRRHPKSRTRGRRGRWVGPAPTLVTCPQCKTLILPHRVCPSCGHYAGREVVAAETPRAKKKKER